MKKMNGIGRALLKVFLAAYLMFGIVLPAHAEQKELTINLKSGELEQLITEIKRQSGVNFFYDDSMANIKLPAIHVDHASIEKVLSEALKGTSITFKMEDNIVYLKRKAKADAGSNAINGSVKDARGEALIGVNVIVKGTKTGTVTDVNGNFSLSGVGSNQELLISYMGYNSQTIGTGKNTQFVIVLDENTQLLNEVIVTALGIKREKKALGYSVQEIKAADLNTTGDASITGALQGKVAGLQINTASTGLGGSTKITIRGNSSLKDNNQPLWVVDGVPFSDNSSSTASLYGGVDRGNTSFDINPEDVESITVLKGPNAAALYGSRAGNGVIMVTTKRGSSKSGIGVSYNGNLTWSEVAETMDIQNKYGQGNLGVYDNKSQYSWGDTLDGSNRMSWNGTEYPYQQYGNKLKDYFNTGLTQTHNVSVDGMKDGADYRASFGFNDNKGIFQGETLKKYNLDLKSGMKFNKIVSMDTKISLSNTRAENRPVFGKGGEVYQLLFIPNNIRLQDIESYKSEQSPHTNWVGPTPTIMNPYYISNRFENEDERWRGFGYYNLKLNFSELFNFSAKYAFDYHRTKVVSKDRSDGIGSTYITKDRLSKGEENFYEQNIEFLLTGSKKIGEKHRFGYTTGTNFMYNKFESLNASISNLLYKEIWCLMNVGKDGDRNPTESMSEKKIHSVFAALQYTYNDYLTLDVTARNDWSSTLKDPYFYPSSNLSFLPGDMCKQMDVFVPNWISFSKIRLSVAGVGKDTEFSKRYNYREFGYQNGQTIVILPTVKANPNLKPEISYSYEAGLEMKFLNNRLGFDFTYYHSETGNQVMDIEVAASSAYSKQTINSGTILNKGFELMLYTTPIMTKNFDFHFDLNVSRNESKIVALHPTSKSQVLGNSNEEFIISLKAIEGHKMGEIFPKYIYDRDPSGNIYVKDGIPLKKTNSSQTIGTIEPKLLMSVTPSIRYKSFSVSALINMKFGGNIVSMTEAVASQFGTAKRTENRGDFIVKGVNIDGTPNTTPVSVQAYYSQVGGETAVAEEFLYDASFIKLKEISFAYNFSHQVLKKTPFNSLRLSLVGRNLCYLMKHTPGTSPEGGFDTSMFSQSIDFTAVPYTRTLGFSLNVGF